MVCGLVLRFTAENKSMKIDDRRLIQRREADVLRGYIGLSITRRSDSLSSFAASRIGRRLENLCRRKARHLLSTRRVPRELQSHHLA